MTQYQITLEQSGRSLQGDRQQLLLETLKQHQVPIEYQCQQGYCGACRTPLLQGEVHYTETPLAPLQATEILPCCCTPLSNLILPL